MSESKQAIGTRRGLALTIFRSPGKLATRATRRRRSPMSSVGQYGDCGRLPLLARRSPPEPESRYARWQARLDVVGAFHALPR